MIDRGEQLQLPAQRTRDQHGGPPAPLHHAFESPLYCGPRRPGRRRAGTEASPGSSRRRVAGSARQRPAPRG